MMNILFSPSKNMFYAENWDYDTVPDDVLAVTVSVFSEFTGNPPAGKCRGAGVDGYPAWQDLPPPTEEERIAAVEHQRNLLLEQANKITADWRTELTLGIISDEDKTQLVKWMEYIKEVKSIPAASVLAADFAWPLKPLKSVV